jgi:hypothetical protein
MGIHRTSAVFVIEFYWMVQDGDVAARMLRFFFVSLVRCSDFRLFWWHFWVSFELKDFAITWDPT